MDLKQKYETDPVKEVDGIPVQLDQDCKIYVARWNNPRCMSKFQEVVRPYKTAMQNGTLDEDLSRTLMNKVMASTILVGWENLKEDGKLIKYSVEEAERVLNTYKEFRSQVQQIANDIENYKRDEEVITEKN